MIAVKGVHYSLVSGIHVKAGRGKYSMAREPLAMTKLAFYIVSDEAIHGAWGSTPPVSYSRNGFSEHESSWSGHKAWL